MFTSRTLPAYRSSWAYQTSLPHGFSTIFGVVTVNSLEQALARAEDGTTNKGYESAVAAVTMANLRRKLAE